MFKKVGESLLARERRYRYPQRPDPLAFAKQSSELCTDEPGAAVERCHRLERQGWQARFLVPSAGVGPGQACPVSHFAIGNGDNPHLDPATYTRGKLRVSPLVGPGNVVLFLQVIGRARPTS